jgi:hypothetical protein
MYSDYFLAKLRRETAERRAKRAVEAASSTVDPRAKLKRRVVEWYTSLPSEARAPHYFMEDLVRQLRATPQQLGLALAELGWERRRVWVKGQPYRHHWIPPETDLRRDMNQRPPAS